MRVAVLHQDLEWSERLIRQAVALRGHECALVDIRAVDAAGLAGFDLVLNRVYASVANRNWLDNAKTLAVLEDLAEMGVQCINSLPATRADYDKCLAGRAMAAQGIATPPTRLLHGREDYVRQAGEIAAWGFPLVVKPNMGGRAREVRKLNHPAEFLNWLDTAFSRVALDRYAAGFVVQPYLKNARPYDIRIAIIDGDFAYAYSRSLVALEPAGECWVGSVSLGSTIGEYSPGEEEIALAARATEAIGATINEVDLMATEAGFVVIENNPTPGFIAGDEPLIDLLVERLLAPPYRSAACSGSNPVRIRRIARQCEPSQ